MPGDDFDTELENLIGGAKKAAAPVVARATEAGGAAKDAFDHELAGLLNRAPAPAAPTPPFPEQAPATGEKYVRGLQSRDIEQPPTEPPGAWYSRFLPKLDTSGKTDLSNLYGAGSFLGAQDEVSGAVTNALPSPKDPEGMHREYAAGTRAQDTKDWVLRQQDKAFKEDPIHAGVGAGMAMGATGLAEGAGLAKAIPSVARTLGPAAAKWALPSVAGLAGATAADIAHREGTLGDRAQQVVDNLAEHPIMNPETIGAALPAAGTAAAPYLANFAKNAKDTSNRLLTHVFMGPEARAAHEQAFGETGLQDLGEKVANSPIADVPWWRPRTAGAFKSNAYKMRNAAIEEMAPAEEQLAATGAKIPMKPIAEDVGNLAKQATAGVDIDAPSDARVFQRYADRLAETPDLPIEQAIAQKRELYDRIKKWGQSASARPAKEMARKRVAHLLKEGIDQSMQTNLPELAPAYTKAKQNFGLASEVLDPSIKLAERNAEALAPSELGLATAMGPSALAATTGAKGMRTMLPSTWSRMAAGASNAAQGGSWISKFLGRKAGTVGASTATTAAAIRDRNKATKDELNSLLDRDSGNTQ